MSLLLSMLLRLYRQGFTLKQLADKFQLTDEELTELAMRITLHDN